MILSVIIVNYNTTSHLRTCLESIYKYTSNLDFEVIVVDNDSPNREIENFKSYFPKIKLFLRKSNDGFGAGCNYGFSQSSGRYIAFVNPDVEINSNLLSQFVKQMDIDPELGVLSPVYLDRNGKQVYIFKEVPGYLWSLAEGFGSVFYDCLRTVFPFPKASEVCPFRVRWVSGSFMFIRREAFIDVKGFDENFFLYYEDIDLQFRIGKMDQTIKYDPRFCVKHFERSSIRSFEGENLYYFHMNRSHLIYINKHFSFHKRVLIRWIHICSVFYRILTVPFRPAYRNKRKQKFLQLLTKLKQYTSSIKRIQNDKYSDFINTESGREQVIHNDSFWK